jgi:uncharacterized protein (DUF433 family)
MPVSKSALTMVGVTKVRIPYSPFPQNGDPRSAPVYSIAEVSYFLRIPKPTLHRWTRHWPTRSGEILDRLIPIADPAAALMSFYNLAEAHILSVTLRVHKVKVKSIRNAIRELRAMEKISNPNHPLLSREFYTDGMDLFIKNLGSTVNVSRFGQLGLKEILDSYLKRIERDDRFNPTKLYPVHQKEKFVSILPTVSSGRPIIDGTGIPVASIWNRYKAGDGIEQIADDYEIPESQIAGALDYFEQLRAAA